MNPEIRMSAHLQRRAAGKPSVTRGIMLDRRERVADLIGLLRREDITFSGQLAMIALQALNEPLRPPPEPAP